MDKSYDYLLVIIYLFIRTKKVIFHKPFAFFTYACGVPTFTVTGDAHKETLSEDCLNCLCKELTHCNLERGCSKGNCGMFAITEPFWLDAGSPKVRSHTKQSTGKYKQK